MIGEIKKQVEFFSNDISSIEKQNLDIYLLLVNIKKKIKENTRKYFVTDNLELQETLKTDLIRYYNLLYYYQAKLNGLNRAYLLDEEIEQLPQIYLVEQLPKRFEIDKDLLSEINVVEGLTMEQAMELLKWSVNNTRNNLNLEEEKRTGMLGNVYGNSSLGGTCGFSQFSTLYPLQQLGLEVTINNVGDACGVRHAYGTVVIPIRINDKIVKKRFLLDCTYRQFFTVPFNVAARYLSHSPSVGFFVSQDKEQVLFAKELLENGFVEASLENMEKYLKPFFSSSISLDNISEIDKKFNEINIFEVLDKKQTEFDYTEEEFVQWGFNLSFPEERKKRL